MHALRACPVLSLTLSDIAAVEFGAGCMVNVLVPDGSRPGRNFDVSVPASWCRRGTEEEAKEMVAAAAKGDLQGVQNGLDDGIDVNYATQVHRQRPDCGPPLAHASRQPSPRAA